MFIRKIKVFCDAEGCDESIEVDTHLALQAQNTIKLRRWTVSILRGIKYHYCPKCSLLLKD
jgi:hypothetical protein